jgi:RNA polymerase sigma factor (sigma-70 family)
MMIQEQYDTEMELVADATAGDAIALQTLLHRYRGRLLEYIRRKMPSVLVPLFTSEDVFQDVCVEAFRGIGQFSLSDRGASCSSSFGAWLLTIARHQMIDLLRVHNAKKRGSGRLGANPNRLLGQTGVVEDDETHVYDGMVALLETLAVYRRTPSKSAAAHETAAALERSIDRLPPDYRQAIRLRHVEGMAPKEAAARMKRSEGAFHLLCNRGLKALRVELRSESSFF